MKKGLKITIAVIVSLVIAIGVFALIWFKGKNYKNFYAQATQEFQIPGLNEGLVPQGLTYHQNSQNFLVAGYMKDGSASRVYVVGEEVKYFTLKTDGADYVGHAGGIATYGDYGYLVGDKKLCIFNINDALELENGKSVNILASFDTPNGADFINIQNGKVYLGEFYHETKYPTSAKHHIATANNDMNYAVTYVYDIQDATPGNPYHFYVNDPTFAISTTEKVQGMCFAPDGKVVLSTSWSLSDSKLYVYKALNELETQEFKFSDDKTINMYVLDDTNLLKTFEAPSMSEEVTLVNGKVYVVFENACAKYKMVTRHKNTNAYSFEVEKLLEN